MAVELYQITVAALDPARQAGFWAQVLGYRVVLQAPGEVVIGRDEHSYPGIVFVPTAGEKTGQNRLHLDLTPDDFEVEVQRIMRLGARRVDVGQGEASWAVLADPEGNEFCVLRPKTSLTG